MAKTHNSQFEVEAMKKAKKMEGKDDEEEGHCDSIESDCCNGKDK